MIIVWLNLSIKYKYRSEIKRANVYIENLKNYQKKNGVMPNENDWKTLDILNPIKPFNESKPQYDKVGKKDFILTFVQGFDPPYLFYDSRTNIWKYDFPPINDLNEN